MVFKTCFSVIKNLCLFKISNLFLACLVKIIITFICNFLCPGRESNSHALRHTILSRACLPFHHPGKFSLIVSRFSLIVKNYDSSYRNL